MAARFRGLDAWPTTDVMMALWSGQMQAVAACLPALDSLSETVDLAADRLSRGGRLVYVGVGSSGVIAALDAGELGATFDWPESRTVVVLPAGLDLSKEQAGAAEDDFEAGAARLASHGLSAADVVAAVSASGTSAFTLGAVDEANRQGAFTIAFVNTADSPLARAASRSVIVDTGDEVIAGSTRLGAGTAQKVLFNLFSTAVMVRLGGVHHNLMVNVRAENAKLRARCAAMIAHIAGVDVDRGAEAFARFGSVKRAVLALKGVDPEAIDRRLAAAGGVLRRALKQEENA
jgi:N-acetylmuramic acid 6-phosphate etherase